MSLPLQRLPLEQLISVSVDVINLSRLSRVLNRSPRLFRRLCSPDERADLCAPEGVGLSWAACLCTWKEAASKCLQTGFWRAGIDWPDLEIRGTFIQ